MSSRGEALRPRRGAWRSCDGALSPALGLAGPTTMAYLRAMPIEDLNLKFDAAGLVTVIAQDRHSGEVRMLAHADAHAVEQTLKTGKAWFYSRSRKQHWLKGETSGNTLAVHEVWTDCDADAIVYLVEPAGPSCHTGRETCFFRRLDDAPKDDAVGWAQATFGQLENTLEARKDTDDGTSYTRQLLDAGAAKIGEKIREEADELARAVEGESDERVVSEAADLIYHAMVGLLSRGVTLRQVQAELARRFGTSGLAEKASRGKSS